METNRKFFQIKFHYLISKPIMVQFKVTSFAVVKEYAPYLELHQPFKNIYFLCISTSLFYSD